MSIAGRGPALDLSRDYDSGLAGQDSAFGFGWAFRYGMRLSVGSGGVVTVVQENGSQVSFQPSGSSYVAPHRVQATLVKNSDGSWTMVRKSRLTFGFSSDGKLTTIRDHNGYLTTVTYPSSTSIKVFDAAGRSLTFTLSGTHIRSVKDSSSPARTLSYSYDASGNLQGVLDAAGGVTTFGYDGLHRLTTIRSPNNQSYTTTSPLPVTTNEYDSSGRVVTQTDPLGRATTFNYAGPTTVTDPRGNKTIDQYNAYGLLTSRTLGAGTSAAQTSTFEYDPVTLNRTLRCDGRGDCTQSKWDSHGNLIKATDAVGQVTTYTYDALGDQTSVTTPLGFTTTKTYSATGNLLTVSRPLLASDGSTTATQKTTFTYGGSAGDVTAMVDPRGNTWKYTYDSYGDKTSVTAPGTPENSSGNKTTWAWDTGRGVPTSMTRPLGNVPGATASAYTTTYAYDALNRRTSTTNADWSSSSPTLRRTTVTFDRDGNQTSVRGPDGQVQTTSYDAADEAGLVTRADGSTMRYAYWPDGSLKSRTTTLGSVTSYDYDAAGNRVLSTDPLGRLTCSTFDAAGLLSATWHLAASASTCGTRPSDHYTAYTRDGEGRTTAIKYGVGQPVSLIVYDADGRKTQTRSGSASTIWKYDSLGRVTEKDPPAATGDPQLFTYDLGDNATAIKLGTSTTQRYFDAAGRLSGVTDYLYRDFVFAYDADSNLKTTTYPSASGNQDTYSYDAATDAMLQAQVAKSSTALATFSYTRDSAGRVSTATTTGPTDQAQSDAYTASGQLAHSGPSGTGYTNTYDADEQLTAMPTSGSSSTQQYDAAGEVCWTITLANKTGSCSAPPTGARTFTYDAAGDRASVTFSGGTTSYSYDDASRLTQITGSSGTSVASYTYDTEGLRNTKTDANATTTIYNWDTTTMGTPALLSDGTWNFVYGPGGRPLEQINPSGSAWYLHTDQLGSVRYLTDETGAYAGQAAFSAYGKPYSRAGQLSPLGFAGQYTDPDTNQIYMRARTYDPGTGQFTTVDPLVDQTEQPYAYAGGDPVNYLDPSGLAALPVSIGGVLARGPAAEFAPEFAPVAVGAAARGAAIRAGGALLVAVGVELAAADELGDDSCGTSGGGAPAGAGAGAAAAAAGAAGLSEEELRDIAEHALDEHGGKGDIYEGFSLPQVIEKIRNILDFGEPLDFGDKKWGAYDEANNVVVIVNPWGRGGTSYSPDGPVENIR